MRLRSERRTSASLWRVRPMHRKALLQAFSQARGVIVEVIDLSRKIFQRMKKRRYPPHCVHVAASGLLLCDVNVR